MKYWRQLFPQKYRQRVNGNGRIDKLLAGQAPNTTPPSHLIELRHVVKTYHSSAGDFTALKGIDLVAQEGEFLAIIGRSGSGKSTLINMITGIDLPSSGEVWVGGTAVHRMTEGKMAEWRGLNLGVIFQFFQLLPTLTLMQNVMLPMDFCLTYPIPERRERAMALLEQVGLANFAHNLPSAVSGGHQQLAAVARALANDPPILIADEPTGNLDSRTAETVFQLFNQLIANGKTIIMVTHDQEKAKRVTRAITVVDGELVDNSQWPDDSDSRPTDHYSLPLLEE